MKRTGSENRIFFERVLAVAAALFVWQAAASAVDSRALLAAPLDVLEAFGSLVFEAAFRQTVWFSLWRIVTGFLLAFVVGSILAVLSGTFHIVEVLLWPYLALIKATPVASFIILCLIWIDSKNLSVCISFLMVMPVVYSNVLASLRGRDKKMAEMARTFSMPCMTEFLYIDLPQMKQYILSACSTGMGLAWKAGISAEVIGIPGGSIGERLYQAKIYLSSEELFAWTITLVFCSIVFEKLFLWLITLCFEWLEGGV